MRDTHIIKTLMLATVSLAYAQTASPLSLAPLTETTHRILRAEKDNDRSELPFLEETAFYGENLPGHVPDCERAADAYLKIANLDESIDFARKLYNATNFYNRSYQYGLFLDKAIAEEKDVSDETREKLYAFLLEVAQVGDYSRELYKADTFLLERIPEYAISRQRATLARYADGGNDWVTNNVHPIKVHFDKIPPKDRPDLRDRFPNLPPLPDDPPEPEPSPPRWPIPAAALLLLTLAALALLKLKKGRAP